MTNRTPVPQDLSQGTTVPGATNRQLDYLASLLQEREMPEDAREALSIRLANQINVNEEHGDMTYSDDGITKARASNFIGRLLNQPKRPAERPARVEGNPMPPLTPPTVPAGRYALKEEDGVTRFYRVDRPTEGRWAGYVFVKIQASDDLHPIKDRSRKAAIIAAIEEDPRGAAILYGQEIGSCGVCGRTLTDETSRAYGIGPICRERTGW